MPPPTTLPREHERASNQCRQHKHQTNQKARQYVDYGGQRQSPEPPTHPQAVLTPVYPLNTAPHLIAIHDYLSCAKREQSITPRPHQGHKYK